MKPALAAVSLVLILKEKQVLLENGKMLSPHFFK
jgi:hypothetical protein